MPMVRVVSERWRERKEHLYCEREDCMLRQRDGREMAQVGRERPYTAGRAFRAVLLLLLFLFLLPLFLTEVLVAQNITSQTRSYPEVRHGKSLVLREVKPVAPHAGSSDPEDDASAGPRATPVIASATAHAATVQAVPTAPLASIGVSAGINIEGIDADGSRSVPDTDGAVGATQYVQWVNLSFSVFDKSSGALLYGPAAGNTLWTGFGGPCETSNDGDIVVDYDKIANVWVMSQHAYANSGAPFYLCIAVSTSSDATGTWNRYAVSLPNYFPDYPKLAVWPDAYYVSINEQNPITFGNLGALVCALDRQSMLLGVTPSPSQCFQLPVAYQSLLPSDLDGATLPPSGAPNYFLNLGSNSLNLWKFHVDWKTPANTTFTGPIAIPVSVFTKACGGSSTCVPQLGTTTLLDGIGDRLMFRVGYRHFADGHESLVASHSVSPPSGIRWYEIQNPGGTPEVFQQATFAPDSSWRWMPSIAMDQMGDIAVGYSVSSSTMLPAIRYTGRLQSDPLNTMQSENSIIEGTGFQQGSNRWGDYSAMTIDPSDDCTFYYTNEYQAQNGSSNWHTRIASFKFPSCTSNHAVTLGPSGLFFGTYAVGLTSPTQNVTLTNNQTVALNISAITMSGDFAQTNTCGSSVGAQGTCTFTVSFTPTVAGIRTGQIVISDDAAGSPHVVNLTGTAGSPIVALSQTSLSFGTIVRNTLTKSVKLTNNGSAVLNLNSIVASGDYSVGGTCAPGGVLSPSASCTVVVTFTPTVTGAIAGAISISDNAPGSPHLINLSGNGQATLSVSPLSLNLGTIAVGSTSAGQTVTIANNAATAQTFSYTSSGNFGVVPSGTTPCGSSPFTLSALSKCTLSVTFSPTSNGTIKGGLTITDTAAGVAYNPQIVGLGGSGTGGAVSSLSFSPLNLGFGNVVLGSSLGPKLVSVKNSSTSSISIVSVTPSGDFSISATGTKPCQNGTVLSAGLSCTMSLTFTPSVQGSVSGSVTIVDNATTGPTTQVFALSGAGVWPVVLSPTSLAFSAQAVGTTSAAKNVTIQNYSSSSVTLNGFVSSGDYSVSSGGTSPCGTTVAAANGQTPGSCTLAVTFTPAVTGVIKGAVTVTHNAAGNNSPQVVGLSGTGQ